MFLATTALTEFWDRDRQLLMLGNWCLRYDRRQDLQGLSYSVLPCPWDDRERFYRTAAELDTIYERLLPWLGEALGRLHQCPTVPVRYWRVLVGPWLFRYLHTLFDRYTCVKEALAVDPALYTWTLDAAKFVTPFDTRDFIRRVLDDHYNLQLLSEVFVALSGSFEAHSPNQWPAPEAPSPAAPEPKRSPVDSWLLRHPGRLTMCDMNLGRADLMKVALWSGLQARPLRFPAITASLAPIDQAFRQSLASPPLDTEFGRVLGHSLPLAMPQVYVEDFHRLRSSVPAGFPRSKVVVSAAGWHDDEAFKFYAAESMAGGTALVSMQHGGAYGTFQAQPQETHEVAVADAFLTWGWQQDARHVAVPSAHLAAFAAPAQKPDRPSGELLLLTTSVPRYLYLFQSGPVASQFEEYLAWHRRFFEALGAVADRVKVRVHPLDYSHGIKERLQALPAKVIFDAGRASAEAMAASAMVLIDHPITAMLESLVMNRPTLLFWDPGLWEVRPEAAGAFERLVEAGILHYSPESAAVTVAQAAGVPATWWAQPRIQAARKLVVDEFADTGPNWPQALVRQLRQIETPVLSPHLDSRQE